MPIKIELKDIPSVAAASLNDLALISYGYNGAARLLALDDIGGGTGGSSEPIFAANDGNLYQLTGTVVDGEVSLGAAPAGEVAGPLFTADDGLVYRLVGVVVDGNVTLRAELA